MLKVVSFIICDSLQRIPNPSGRNVHHIIKPMLAVRPIYIPSSFSFCVAFGVGGANLSVQHGVDLILRDPKGSICCKLSNSLLPPPLHKQKNIPDNVRGFMVYADFRNITISVSGIYKLEIILDKKISTIKDIPIYKKDS